DRGDRQQQGRLESRRSGQPQQPREGQGQRQDRRPDRGPRPDRPDRGPRQPQQGQQPRPQQQPQQPPQQQQPATPSAEAPQFHSLAGEGQVQGQRPEREGEEPRRGRRNRGGRDRDR